MLHLFYMFRLFYFISFHSRSFRSFSDSMLKELYSIDLAACGGKISNMVSFKIKNYLFCFKNECHISTLILRCLGVLILFYSRSFYGAYLIHSQQNLFLLMSLRWTLPLFQRRLRFDAKYSITMTDLYSNQSVRLSFCLYLAHQNWKPIPTPDTITTE